MNTRTYRWIVRPHGRAAPMPAPVLPRRDLRRNPLAETRRRARLEGRPRPLLRRAAAALAAGFLVALMALVYHVYFDRSDLPDIESIIQFEAPTIGEVFDARGKTLIQLAKEYRRVVTYDQVPPILRDAILSAEDKNFFTHSGVDFAAWPRVVEKTAVRSFGALRSGKGFRLVFPQGGSTLTQQLVRGYFLQHLTSRENGSDLIRGGIAPGIVSTLIGVPAVNKLLRKVEEVRLSLWLEEEMRRRYGSQEIAKREIFARYASFIYLGHGRYGFAAGSEYYFGKPLSAFTSEDGAIAASLAGICKCPRDYAPAPGDPRPLSRRNEILALMARNGAISPAAAKRWQAEPIRLASRSGVKTYAPAAIESVFDELKRHGKDRFELEDLFEGRIAVRSTIDQRAQTIVNDALENGLALYEKRHPKAKGVIQGSVVVLRNSDAAILAEAGGRQVYRDHPTAYSDYNRVTESLRQPGSAMKPLVYLAAFHEGLDLDSKVPDKPIKINMGRNRGVKWIANYDKKFKGRIPARQALAESRNTVAIWLARQIGMESVLNTARQLGIRTELQPYISTALGASEVRLLELAGAYRAMASGILAEPHIIDQVTDSSCGLLYQGPRTARPIRSAGVEPEDLRQIQEGLRGVVRLPDGTAHNLSAADFPIPVMAKTGTSSDFRDAMIVGSTFGRKGITVAVRVGFDDNRELGEKETGGRTALPIFKEIMLQIYQEGIAGPVPKFPQEMEDGIDQYLARAPAPEPGEFARMAEQREPERPRPAAKVAKVVEGKITRNGRIR
jgi:penicillin-binding protein 1A